MSVSLSAQYTAVKSITSIVDGDDKRPGKTQIEFLLGQARVAAVTLAKIKGGRGRAGELEAMAVERMISIVSGAENAPRGERRKNLLQYAAQAAATLLRLHNEAARNLEVAQP